MNSMSLFAALRRRAPPRRMALVMLACLWVTAGRPAAADADNALPLADTTVIAVDAATLDVRITDSSPRDSRVRDGASRDFRPDSATLESGLARAGPGPEGV